MQRSRILSLLALSLMLSIGCAHVNTQQPTTPIYNCPSSATVGTYLTLNLSSPVSAVAYNDQSTASGEVVCYIVQSKQSGGTSAPSNIAGPFFTPNTAVTHSIALAWTAPAPTSAGPYTYIVSRVDAVQVQVTPPVLGTSPTISEVNPSPKLTELAQNNTPSPIMLHGRLKR